MRKILPGVVFLGMWTAATTSVNALVINEFLPSPPSGSNEWVEFYNEQDDAEYIKSYWLDDDTDFALDDGNQGIKPLTNLHTDNVHYPYFEMINFLNNTGDWVVLFDDQGNIIDQYEYTENPGTGISIGRDPDQTGDMGLLDSVTKGAPNTEDASPTTIPSPTDEPEPTNEPEPTEEPLPTEEPTPTDTPIPTPEITISPTPTSKPLPRLAIPTPRAWKCEIQYEVLQYMRIRIRFPRLNCRFE